jgi:hypothetical protein
MNLIECSCLSGESYFFDSAALDQPEIKLRAYDKNGNPKKWHPPGVFEWWPLVVHPANIVERGTPRLSHGWKDRAEAAREIQLADFFGKPSTEKGKE